MITVTSPDWTIFQIFRALRCRFCCSTTTTTATDDSRKNTTLDANSNGRLDLESSPKLSNLQCREDVSDGDGDDDGDGDGDFSRKWFFPKGRQWVRCWLAEMVFPILLSGSSPSSSSSSSSPPISTRASYSLLCRSLPYALPPVGDLRWSRPLPAPIPGWEGTRNAR